MSTATPTASTRLERNGWSDTASPSSATGDEFEEFLVEQDTRVADTLKELGLA